MATAFNQDLSSWNASDVSNMKLAFEDASNFEVILLDVSNVSDMYGMFAQLTLIVIFLHGMYQILRIAYVSRCSNFAASYQNGTYQMLVICPKF